MNNITGADNWKPNNGEKGSGFSFQIAVEMVEAKIKMDADVMITFKPIPIIWDERE